jgi:DNA-binding IclR family transcriptional regulator
MLDGTAVTYIEKAESNNPVSMVFESTTLPAHATAMGKALLAFSSSQVVDEVIDEGLARYTPFTLISPDRLRRALATIRLTRVAVSRRELELGSSAVAVPVFGAGGAVAAALELGVRDTHDLRLVQPPLIVAARSLSRELHENHARGHLTLGLERHLDIRINGHTPLVSGHARRDG